VILVGHSFGGSVISKAVEFVPDQVQRLIYVDAFVLEDNQSIYDNLPGALIELLDHLSQASRDNTSLIPRDIWRNHFIQDAPEEVAQALWELLSPEPNQSNVEKLDLKTFYSLDIPKSYISCRQDMSLPPGTFHPQMSSRLGACKLVEMDGSHEVMFTRPAELADAIIQASSE
jgi:pimeloyl-ACP methyl ester carboxylesterase